MKTPLAFISRDKEIIDLAKACDEFELVGVFDINPEVDCYGLKYLGTDSEWNRIKEQNPRLVAALALDPTRIKEKAAKHYGPQNLATLISPKAYVCETAKVGAGTIVQMGCKIMSDANVGIGCKINVNATVHHDNLIGNFCTLAPGCQVLGYVQLGERVYIGAGAILLPYVKVGAGATIGAGAVVTKDVPAETTVVGIPAKLID